MITITKNGNAVLFEFDENQHYLYNGTIEVPLNSLSLVTDESEMFTFKKAATNDIFISARYADVNMSKSQLIDFYIANMVGGTGGGSESGITSGDVESMISASLEDYYDIDEIDAALSGKQDTLIAGSGITISGNVISSEGGNNVIELTQAEYDALVSGGTVDPSAFYIITDATEINISDYYTSAQTQSAINAAVSGKADTSSVYTKSEVDTALSGKQDVSGMTAYTTSSDVESYVSGFTYDKASIDEKVASGGTFDPTQYYTKTATDALLDDKFDASAFTAYSAATDARLSEDEEVTAAALNALNDELSGKADSSDVTAALSGKADTSAVTQEISAAVSGKADSSSVYTKAEVDAVVSGKADSSAVTEISSAVSGKMDTSVFNTYSAATDAKMAEDEEVTAAALNALNDALSGKADSSAVTQEIAAAVSGKVDTSAITTSITSSSTNVQVPSAKAVYDKLGGLSLVKLSQVQYEALSPNYDNNTLYVIVG